MLGSHECDEFDESEEKNQFRKLAEFGSSLFLLNWVGVIYLK